VMSCGKGPACGPTRIILLVLALVLYVFGFVYVLAPAYSISSIQSIANGIGLHLPVPPTEPSGFFYGWIGFTFAYMMAAASCALLASSPSPERPAYLNVLLVLKGTSSMTGLVLFVRGPAYAFYLSTFLIDGLLFLLVLVLRIHLTRRHELGRTHLPGRGPAAAPGTGPPSDRERP
jgi:hypothetical protein